MHGGEGGRLKKGESGSAQRNHDVLDGGVIGPFSEMVDADEEEPGRSSSPVTTLKADGNMFGWELTGTRRLGPGVRGLESLGEDSVLAGA